MQLVESGQLNFHPDDRRAIAAAEGHFCFQHKESVATLSQHINVSRALQLHRNVALGLAIDEQSGEAITCMFNVTERRENDSFAAFAAVCSWP